ncbi:MAG: hypothetical protein P1V35_05045 [Planctomycetota bacterium]|nr:hypothetical protein [Planctomycetota bacterium]
MQIRPHLWLLCAATLAHAPALASQQLTQEPAAETSTPIPAVNPVSTQPNFDYERQWSPALDNALRPAKSPRTPIVITPVADPSLAPDSEFLEDHKSDAGAAPLTQVRYDVQRGKHWAMGLAYKASLGSEGFTYMPFLGSHAPKTYGVTMRLGSATIGGEPISLDPRTGIRRTDDRYILDRGPIDVWYDMGLESVEQSFALEVSGVNADLVLGIDVTSDLIFEKQSGALAYLNEFGGVQYDKALVIDGAGQRLELPIEANADRITLTVPASFMKDSVAPVVVDPVFTTYQVNPGYTRNLTEPDVAYDQGTDRFAFVHSSEWSATDFDVWIETRTPSNGSVDTTTTIDFTTDNVKTPMVANDNTSDQFLVTSRRLNADGYWEIIGRTVDANDITQQSPVVLIGDANATWENGAHDLGGKSQGASLFISVWERTFASTSSTNIRRRMITPIVPFSTVTPPTLSNLAAVTSSSSFNDTQIRVSESSGEAIVAEWRILFINTEIATGDQQVISQRFADDGSTNSGLVGYDISPAATLADLDVSTGLAQVDGINSAPTYGAPLMFNSGVTPTIWMFGYNGDTLFGGTNIKLGEHTNQLNRPRYPAISVSATRFNLTYVEFSTTSASTYTCYTTAMDLTNTLEFGIVDRRMVVRELSQSDFKRPASASRYEGGNYASRYVGCAVTDFDGTFNVQAAATVHPFSNTTPAHQFCQSTPNSTGDYSFLRLTGTPFTVGTKVLYASAMPLNQFGYFLVGQGTTSVTPPGSSGTFCIAGAAFGRYNGNFEIFYTSTLGEGTHVIDPSNLRGPSGDIVGQAGETWNFQAWHRENGGDSNFTNAVSLFLE